tara:strand:- start:5797 stop:6258 length:462 start_codon:yes stop_codon:yes gene_type:complete
MIHAAKVAFCSLLTIFLLCFLSSEINASIFLIGSFGATMVLLFGVPESPFSQPKNIFFGHFLTALVGIVLVMVLKIPTYFLIPLSVGIGIFLMLITNTTHPPAGGNPIVIIEKGDDATLSFLLDPIIYSCSLIIIVGIILNRLILKSNYPKKN